MNKLKKVLFLFAFANMVTISNSYATRGCTIELFDNLSSSFIEDQITDQIVNTKHELTNRKTLHIIDVEDVNINGCNVQMKLQVKLTRKLRKDAFGKIGIKATIKTFNRSRVCLKNPKVTSVNLSETLDLEEEIYKLVANIVLPHNKCFDL